MATDRWNSDGRRLCMLVRVSLRVTETEGDSVIGDEVAGTATV